MIVLWSPKGGSGTSVVAAALALVLSRSAPSILVDLAGDQAALFGLTGGHAAGLDAWLEAESPDEDAISRLGVDVAPGLALVAREDASDPLPAGAGAALAGALRSRTATAVVDAGAAPEGGAREMIAGAEAAVVVVRACYLGLRRAVADDLVRRAAGVVVVLEPGRALTSVDVGRVLGLPVLAEIQAHEQVARAVDAGTLATRLPGVLARPAVAAVQALSGTADRPSA